MAKSLDKFLATANRILKTPEPLPDSLPAISREQLEDGVRKVADEAGPLDASVKESLDDSVPRRRALGARVLRELYGEADFGELTEHIAGGAVDAFRAGNIVKGKIGIEQVHMAIEKRRGEGKKSQGNPEEQLKDPARRVAGSAARENVGWAAGQLRVVAGTDIDTKKAQEQGIEKGNK